MNRSALFSIPVLTLILASGCDNFIRDAERRGISIEASGGYQNDKCLVASVRKVESDYYVTSYRYQRRNIRELEAKVKTIQVLPSIMTRTIVGERVRLELVSGSGWEERVIGGKDLVNTLVGAGTEPSAKAQLNGTVLTIQAEQAQDDSVTRIYKTSNLAVYDVANSMSDPAFTQGLLDGSIRFGAQVTPGVVCGSPMTLEKLMKALR